jgi:hypothetical protein
MTITRNSTASVEKDGLPKLADPNLNEGQVEGIASFLPKVVGSGAIALPVKSTVGRGVVQLTDALDPNVKMEILQE